MRAFVCTGYGDSRRLKLQELEKPTPKPDEILVKVKAVSVNSWDWDIIKGAPIIRMVGPLRPPYKVLGADISGVVEAVGANVHDIGVGEEVFGDLSDSGWGGMAEYATGKAEHFTIKPKKLSFEDACCLPQAGLLGFQGIRTFGEVKKGDKVLINGAGGGAGMFAIQTAKLEGAEIWAVDRADKFDAMRKFGADHMFDYKATNYTKLDQQFDVIVDAVAHRSIKSYRRALAEDGRFVMMGGKLPTILGTFLASRKNDSNTQKIKILMWSVNKDDLDSLAKLVTEDKIKVHIHKVFDFEHTPEAVQMVGDQDALGKVIIRVS